MSEFWVSKNKYFCPICKIYIADDKPSRSIHENGLKHKGNLERFIREQYKVAEENEKEKRDTERELKRIEKAARSSLGLSATDEAPAATTSTDPKKPPEWKPTDRYAAYTTAESLGYYDAAAEAEAQAKEEERKKEGRIGEWEVVRKVPGTSRSGSTGGWGGGTGTGYADDTDPYDRLDFGSSSTPSTSNASSSTTTIPAPTRKKGRFMSERTLTTTDDSLDSLSALKLKKVQKTHREIEAEERRKDEEARVRREQLKEIKFEPLRAGEKRLGSSLSNAGKGKEKEVVKEEDADVGGVILAPGTDVDEKPNLKRSADEMVAATDVGDVKPDLGSAKVEERESSTGGVGADREGETKSLFKKKKKRPDNESLRLHRGR